MVEPHFRTSFSGYRGMRNFGDDLFALICTDPAATYEVPRTLRVNGRVHRLQISAFYSTGRARHINRYPITFGRRHIRLFTTDAAVELMPGTKSRP